ncbi:hypothetical protein EDB87DRAFT_1695825 [Lactarius vividus]|nr:hypothetical protein EDB87DRAFT_1695825 [Lactarius vividus]
MASSSFPALSRALSPGASAIVASLERDQDASTRERDLRHSQILACNSLAEIIELIPSDYRELCADVLRPSADKVKQLVRTRTTVAKWSAHLSKGTLPAHLRTSAPKIQFCAGYSQSDAAKAAQKSLDDKCTAHATSLLTLMLNARRAEVTALEEATEPGAITAEMREHIAPRVPSISRRYLIPHETLDADGAVIDTEMVQAPSALAIGNNVLSDVGVYASRMISILLNVAEAEEKKIEKAQSIAAASKVAAADGADAIAGSATLSEAVKAHIERTVMGLLPRKRKQSEDGPSQLTKKAKRAAQAVQAKITPPQPGNKYVSMLPGYVPHAIMTRLRTVGNRAKRKGKGKAQQPRAPRSAPQVVVAKAEGSGGNRRQQQQKQKKKDRKGKGKAQQ